MGYKLTKSDIENLKYVINAIEAEAGDCFGEDECNGKRCFKHCGCRGCCLLRAKLNVSRIIKKAESGKDKMAEIKANGAGR